MKWLFLTLIITVLGLAGSVGAVEPEIVTIKLSFSNVHVLKGQRPILVDAGSRTDIGALEKASRRMV